MAISGGVAVHYPPPPSYLRGVYPPLDFYKVIISKAFDKKQVIYDHWQVGQAAKNGDTPKELFASVSINSVLNAFIFSGSRKLNYRRLEEGKTIFICFYFEQKFLYLLSAFYMVYFYVYMYRCMYTFLSARKISMI